jgi:hypothetical protein
MNLWIEKFCHVAMGFLVGIIYFFECSHVTLPPSMKDVLGAVVNISAIFVAFLSTIWSILISMENKRVIQLLKDAEYDKLLFQYLSAAIRWLFILAVISAVGLLIDFTQPKNWYHCAFSFWLFVLVTSFISCWRIIRIFSKVLIFK